MPKEHDPSIMIVIMIAKMALRRIKDAIQSIRLKSSFRDPLRVTCRRELHRTLTPFLEAGGDIGTLRLKAQEVATFVDLFFEETRDVTVLPWTSFVVGFMNSLTFRVCGGEIG